MFEVSWTALMPEGMIDSIRSKLTAEFTDDFGSQWIEDEINYKVVDDTNFNTKGEYDPIIRATFAFRAVCNVDREDVEVLANHYIKFLNCLAVHDVGITYKAPPETDWTKWRVSVY